MPYRPSYEVSSDMLNSVKSIIRLIGQLEGYQLLTGNLKLRRKNKIRSLHSSLAIEGNRLTSEQVTAILEGKRVFGSRKDILEVQNAVRVYDSLPTIDPYNEEALLSTHGKLMGGLIDDAGRYRNSAVGVLDGDVVVHIGPPPLQVPRLMGDLFDYLVNTTEDIIIKSCVFHYEFEFIHPFSDGNGRMGRLWQTAILKSEYPDLAYVPIESLVYDRQQEYYDALLASQRAANSNPFILYSLSTIQAALEEQLTTETGGPSSWQERLLAFRERNGEGPFDRKQYGLYHKSLATATTTRDLTKGLEAGILTRDGELRTTTYLFT